MVRSRIWGSSQAPQRLTVGNDSERAEAGDVLRLHYLQVANVVARVAPAVGLKRRFHSIQSFSGGTVADGVEMDLKEVPVEHGDVTRQDGRLDHAHPAVVAG